MAELSIIQDMLPTTHPIYGYPMVPEYITIHETANTTVGANAEMHGRYMRSQAAIDREVTWHFTVDDKEIRQHLPLDINGWHAGDGRHGTGNRRSIGIEMCVNADGDFTATQRLTTRLVAHLINTMPSLRPFPECVVQHNRWSGKDCPRQIRATLGAWERFLQWVEEALAKEATAQPTVAILDAAGRLLCHGRLVDGRTVVELRPLAEAMGLTIDWDPGGPAARLLWPGAKQ